MEEVSPSSLHFYLFHSLLPSWQEAEKCHINGTELNNSINQYIRADKYFIWEVLLLVISKYVWSFRTSSRKNLWYNKLLLYASTVETQIQLPCFYLALLTTRQEEFLSHGTLCFVVTMQFNNLYIRYLTAKKSSADFGCATVRLICLSHVSMRSPQVRVSVGENQNRISLYFSWSIVQKILYSCLLSLNRVVSPIHSKAGSRDSLLFYLYHYTF